MFSIDHKCAPYVESDEGEDFDQSEDSDSSTSGSLSRGSTSGVSTMTSKLHEVESGNTLSEFFRTENSESEVEDEESESEKEESNSDEDEGHVEDAPNLSIVAQPIGSMSSTDSSSYQPLKHHLRSICTIGTGYFGRVELAKCNVTGKFYALKSIYIPAIIEKRQVQHVHNEKRILERLNHRFIVKLYDTAKDSRCLYMIMEFLAGGELFSYFRMSHSLPSYVVKFYAAQILCAFEYLHSMSIAFRDLKPENVLLDRNGNSKLVDFGFAKEIRTKSYTICGTTCYLAPESMSRAGHNWMVDFWALGILIFELIAGFTAFPGDTIDEVQSRITEYEGKPEFPRKTFSQNAKDLIIGLLTVDPTKRLGHSSIEEIKTHPWFESISFEEIMSGAAKPPLSPTLYRDGDTGNFDSFQEMEKRPAAKQRDLDLFDEW
ncbi:CAMP-dependent protein kinase, catalytic subunit-like [Aphelenchoides besseyi]|nr:CAMP-dependent protein kinase, catalytic subunit-like [Aphelenchoides besseyi]KAI6209491.1 CAMP-dependent protein kinase, catalytic subunit-like [Aphelenchoides besseyi]